MLSFSLALSLGLTVPVPRSLPALSPLYCFADGLSASTKRRIRQPDQTRCFFRRQGSNNRTSLLPDGNRFVAWCWLVLVGFEPDLPVAA